MERSTLLLIGKPSISMDHVHPFSMAMLNKQRVYMQMAQKPQRTESAHKLFFPRTLRSQPLHGVR